MRVKHLRLFQYDGKAWRNWNYTNSTGGRWEACGANSQNNGKGALYPSAFSYCSITAFNTSTLFMLSKNGTIYNSTNKGVTWHRFGTIGYGYDSGWVSITAGNHKNNSYLYVLYNNGSVYRVNISSFQVSSYGNMGGQYTSWVSITCDSNNTVYILRNYGEVYFKYNTANATWISKGYTIGDKIHQDSSWVSIKAQHVNMKILAMRNDRAIDVSSANSSSAWINVSGSDVYTSYVGHTFNNKWIWALRNNGDIYLSQFLIIKFNFKGTVIMGPSSFVSICSPIDNKPWSDHPADQVITKNSVASISWHIYDDVGVSHYRLLRDGVPYGWNLIPANGSLINFSVDTSLSGLFNYTIVFNDSADQFSKDTVFIRVNAYPWNDPTNNITTNYNDTFFVSWTLYDDWNGSQYRIYVDGVPTNWFGWTNNTQINFPINRSSLGVFNYTIEYSDIYGLVSTDTIFITVQDPFKPWSNSPADIVTYTNNTDTIDWALFDGYAPGYYRVWVNGTPSNWQTWTNNTIISYPINRSVVGIYNYTIEYNDSVGNWGEPDTVWVTVVDAIDPWSNSPANIITTRYGNETIDWILFDNYAPGYYRIKVNNTWISNWTTWTNSTVIHISINRTAPGVYNYTIFFNDSVGNYGIPDSVIVVVKDLNPFSNSPANILTGPNGLSYINWILRDDYGAGYYRVYIDSVPGDWNSWINGTSINYPINKSKSGVFNYTIEYNDSNNNWGAPDTVLVTVDLEGPISLYPNPRNESYVNTLYPEIKISLLDFLANVNASTIEMYVNSNLVIPDYYSYYNKWLLTDIVSTESINNSEAPDVAVDYMGNLHVVWADYSNYSNAGFDKDIFYKMWNITTGRWSKPVVISLNSGDSGYPAIATDKYGFVHVVWSDNSTGNYEIFYIRKSNTSNSWSATTIISSGSTGDSFDPDITVSETGDIHVVWNDYTDLDGQGDTYSDIYYRVYNYTTYTWQSIECLTPNSLSSESFTPKITIDKFGNIHVIFFVDESPGSPTIDYYINYTRWDIDTQNWTASERVSLNKNVSNYYRYGSIAAAKDGKVHLMWSENYNGNSTDYDLFHRIWLPNNESWGKAKILVNNTYRKVGPSIFIDEYNNIHLSWNQDFAIFYKFWNSSSKTWSINEVISTESSGITQDSSIAYSKGVLHIVWADQTNLKNCGTDSDIFHKMLLDGLISVVNWTFTTPCSNGQIINVSIRAADNFGNYMPYFNWSFIVDLQPPNASNPYPMNLSYINKTMPTIRVDLVDLLSGINVSSIKLMINNTVVNHTWDGTTVYYTPTTPYSNGDTILVELNASDLVGNAMDTFRWWFTVDLIGPTAFNPQPGNSTFTNDPTPEISVDLSDNLSGINVSTIVFTVEGSDVIFTWNGSRVSYTPASDYENGEVVMVSITVKDNAGNVLTGYWWYFTVDLAPPYAYNPFPQNNSYTNVSNTRIMVYIEDDLSRVDQNSIIMNVNGTNYTITAPELSYNGTSKLLEFVPASIFDDGYLEIYVDAADIAGNYMDTYWWYFTIDTTPPYATDPFPENGTYTEDNQTLINITVNDDSSGVNFQTLNLWVDNILYDYFDPEISVTNNTITFTPSAQFNNGNITVVFNIRDNVSNLMENYTWYFTVDTIKPNVFNPSPKNNSFVNSKRPTISMFLIDNNIIDNESIILTIEGVDYDIYNGVNYNSTSGLLTFTPATDFSEGQIVDVSLYAKDAAGNELSPFDFSFVIDTIIPTVSILSPISQTYTTNYIWLNLTCNDVNWNSTWYRIYNVSDSVWATSNNISWNDDILLYFEDGKTYRLYAWVNDSAGNYQNTNVTVQFSVDISAPAISILSPINKTYGISNIVIVVDNSSSSSIIDKVWFRYTYNGTFTQNFTMYWNGTYWVNTTTMFNEGSIKLQIFANNTAGRISFAEVWFTVDFTPPSINFTTPYDGDILRGIRNFILEDSDRPDPDIVKIELQYNTNGTWITYGIWVSGSNLSWSTVFPNSFTVDTRLMAGDSDNYTFRFIAYDSVPYQGYSQIGLTNKLTVDNTPPNRVEIITITDNDGVIKNPYYNGLVLINYTAEDALTGIHSEVELYDNSSGMTWILNSTNKPIHWSTTIADDGTHYIVVKVYDNAGNYNTSKAKFIIIDNSNPSTPSITNIFDNYGHSISTGNTFNGTITVVFNAFDAISYIYMVQLYDGVNLIATNNSWNTITFDSTSLADGIYQLNIVAYDYCMNYATSFPPTQIKIDNNPPQKILVPRNLIFEVEDTSKRITWKFNDAFPDRYVIYNMTGHKVASGTWASGTDIEFALGQQKIGNWSYRIIVNDSIGFSIEDIVWVCVQNNTIKAGVKTVLTYSGFYQGLRITITSDAPGNLSVLGVTDPSNGNYPEGYLLIMNQFISIVFITDYTKTPQIDIEITIRVSSAFIHDNNIDINSVKIAYYSGGKWIFGETFINSTSLEYTIKLNHLTYFAIFGKISTGPTGGGQLWLIIIIIAIIGAVGTITTIILVRRKPSEKEHITPRRKKGIDTEKLILERDKYIDLAEKAMNAGDIKEAIRCFEKIGQLSRELGEFDIYNQCVDKVKELRASLISTIAPPKPVEAPPGLQPIPIPEEEGVKVLRGGEVVGGKIIYKVKVKNNTKYNITDVTVFLISYPRECMGLTTKETRSVPKIESGGFRSLEFEFEPHKDCVEGTVHASVTYIDHMNQSHTVSVEPFTIRSVCDLLRPYKVSEEEFDRMIIGWQKTGEFKKVNVNIYDLFEKSKLTLERHNFSIISAKLYESEDTPLVRGLIKAFAEGKYAGKKIGMLIEMMGYKDGALSQIRTSSTSEDEGMMASPIAEVIEDFHESGFSLDQMSPQEQEKFIKEKSLQSLRYLLVVHKDTGITIYSVNFSEHKLDPDLVSGFLSAIRSFGMELSGGQSIGIRKMEYESLKIVLQEGSFINVGLILDDFPEQWLDLRLKTFVKAVENQYKQYLENWTGDVRPFRDIGILFAKIFEIQED
ncbi:MAG: hypothetical protein ACTSPQ_11960 [Candidatus Helarchaeota archaeon]